MSKTVVKNHPADVAGAPIMFHFSPGTGQPSACGQERGFDGSVRHGVIENIGRSIEKDGHLIDCPECASALRGAPKVGVIESGPSRALDRARDVSPSLIPEARRLNKASQNVKDNRAADWSATGDLARKRIMDYIRRSGFHAHTGTQDRFGIGADQRGLSYKPGVGSPEHELAHAIMTPPGEGLREHQRKLGQVSTPTGDIGMTREQATQEEGATFLMQPQIARRAGVKPIDTKTIGGYDFEPPELRSRDQSRGVGELDAFAEGRKMVDKKGNMVPGTNPNAKINARALGKAEGGTRWMGRFIADPDHKHQLDRDSGLLWLQGMDPREAEAHAYDSYKKARHAEAAAHHFIGQRAAQGANDTEQAMKHGALYALHVKALGGNPHGAVPPEVKALADQMEQPKLYRFKPHPGDAHLLSDETIQKMEKSLEEDLSKGTLLQFPTAEAQATPPSGNGNVAPVVGLHDPKYRVGARVQFFAPNQRVQMSGTVNENRHMAGSHHYNVKWDHLEDHDPDTWMDEAFLRPLR